MPDPSWPPASGLTTKIVPRHSAILTLSHATIVHAPASLVFDAILNVADYPEWNTWVPAVRIDSQPPAPFTPVDVNVPDGLAGKNGGGGERLRTGTAMTFTVIMKPDSKTTTSLRVCDISTPSSPSSYLSPQLLDDPSFTADLGKVYRVSWTGNGGWMAPWLKLERFHEVVVRKEGECEVRSWEVMGGVLARVVRGLYAEVLREKMALWCKDLKSWSEMNYPDGDRGGA